MFPIAIMFFSYSKVIIEPAFAASPTISTHQNRPVTSSSIFPKDEATTYPSPAVPDLPGPGPAVRFSLEVPFPASTQA